MHAEACFNCKEFAHFSQKTLDFWACGYLNAGKSEYLNPESFGGLQIQRFATTFMGRQGGVGWVWGVSGSS
jgi:hypothetical protein